uniref:LamG domain-containing protein n=1 Tax=Ningiella ruwaisensis TaxID=2364274 RepID=UPI00109F0CF1|nr:LamG domain-containing protein [Ningiella ruwaisensis]
MLRSLLCRRTIASALLTALLLFNVSAWATQCLDFFPDPIASFSASGTVNFGTNGQVLGSDGVLDIGILGGNHADSCDTEGACISSGTNTDSLNLPSFQRSMQSTDETVAINQSATMNQVDLDNLTLQSNAMLSVQGRDGIVRVNQLNMAANAKIILSSGTYFFNTLSMADGASFDVSGTDKVIVYVNDFTASGAISMNAGGDSVQFVFISSQRFDVQAASTLRGFFYILDTFTLGKNSRVFGAVNAKTIVFDSGAKVVYRAADIEQANFSGACGQNALLPSPILHYTMDMCLKPQRNKGILDSIRSNHADAWNGIEIDYAAQYCQGAKFDGSHTFIDIQDSGLFDLQQGAISFWMKSEDLDYSSRSHEGKQGILSKDTNESILDRLSLLMTDAGALQLIYRSQTNSDFTSRALIQENQWHHVVVTWGPDGIFLFVDAQLEGSDASNTASRLQPNGLDMALGASARNFRLSSNGDRGSQLRDFFKGSIDEFKLFNVQLNAAQIDRLNSLSSQSCFNCSNEPVLLSHYSSDVCSVEANKVVDVVSGYDASVINNVSVNVASRFCQGLAFDGAQAAVRVVHKNAFEMDAGAVSFWFKVPDLNFESTPYDGGTWQLSGMALMSKDYNGNEGGADVEIRLDSEGRIRGRQQGASESAFNSGTVRVSENTWNHLVYSFGNEGLKLYLNGSEIQHIPDYTIGWTNNLRDLIFGASSRGYNGNGDISSQLNNFLKGEIDDIKIYQNQPSDADVVNWFNDSDYACASCSSLVAHYSFDSEGITGDFIEDLTGNGFTGELHPDLRIQIPNNNKQCNALLVPSDRSNDQFKNFDTKIDIDELGNQGGVSFWYRSTVDWGSVGRQQIFDATRGNKYFYLAIRTDGKLAFGAEDVNDRDVQLTFNSPRFAADEWVHIALSWNYDTHRMTLILNGTTEFTRGWNNDYGNIAPYGTLTFGDNKSTYLVVDMTGNSANGYFDEIRVYREMVTKAQAQADMASAQSCQATFSYVIEHPEEAMACGTPSVTLKACADASCNELATDPSTLQLFPAGAWAQSEVTFTGSTQVQLVYNGTGTLTIGSSGQNPVAPVICDPDCTIEYDLAGLEFFHTGSGQTEFSSTPFIAESPLAALGIRAIGQSGDSCDALVSSTQSIDISYECTNTGAETYAPASCNADFAGIPRGSASVHSGQIELSFDENGEASFAGFSYADVGMLNISAQANIGGVQVQSSPTQIKMIPQRLRLSTSAPVKPVAGEKYSFDITAIGAKGSTLVGFKPNQLQLAAKRVVPASTSGSDSSFIFDIGTSVQTSINEAYALTSNVHFNNGQASSVNAFFEEAGTYQIMMRDADYLGSQIEADSLTIGPVIPAYFRVERKNASGTLIQPLLTDAATNFSYVGQTFGFVPLKEPTLQITAYNALGQVTKNYANELWNLPFEMARVNSFVSYTDTSAYSGGVEALSKASALDIQKKDDYNGLAVMRLVQPSVRYTKVVNPGGADTSPFDAQLSVSFDADFFTDTDGVCYRTSLSGPCSGFVINNVSGTQMRYGRLFLENAFGAENRPLRVQARTQYLRGGTWVTNSDDSHTQFAISQSSGGISILHDPQSPSDLSSFIAGIEATHALTNGHSDLNDFVFQPVIDSGTALSGSVFMTLEVQNTANHWSRYLNIDWDGDNDIDENDTPSANIAFGLYRGDDKTIHWREAF